MVNDFEHLYLNHYQKGHGMPVFHGGVHQYGNGLGNILSAIGRFILPIAATAATNFISSTASGLSQGRSLKDSAKQSIAPTLVNTVSNFGDSLNRKLTGSGRKKRRTRRKVKKSNLIVKHRRVYKRRKRANNSTKSKRIKYNF